MRRWLRSGRRNREGPEERRANWKNGGERKAKPRVKEEWRKKMQKRFKWKEINVKRRK